MGIFWDMIQESKIEKQKARSESMEERIQMLEEDLDETRQLLRKTLIALEEHLGKDIDKDGKIGA